LGIEIKAIFYFLLIAKFNPL